MINYKDIESALVEVIKVVYSQGTKKYDKMGLTFDICGLFENNAT